MKIGDLVKCKSSTFLAKSNNVGIIIFVGHYDLSSASYHVQWPDSDLWYQSEDLELVNEKEAS